MKEDISRRIEGYALKFNVKSRILSEGGQYFVEILKRGCITKAMLDTQDFVLTLYHDEHKILARSNKGKGTLHYEVDAVGVKFWAIMPNTQWGDEALELVKRGDVDGCSFIYSTDEQNNISWVCEKGGTKVRYVNKVEHIYDMTLTYRPAYTQTECAQRQLKCLTSKCANARGAMNFSGTINRQATHGKREAQRARMMNKIKTMENVMKNY